MELKYASPTAAIFCHDTQDLLLTLTVLQMIRLTIRATDESVPPVLIKIMEERLQTGISTAPEVHEAPTRREISEAFGNVLVE